MCIYISKASETVCTACSALTLILLKWMIFHLGYWLYFAVIRWPVFCQKCMTRHAHMDLRLTLFMESLPLLRAAMISLGEYYVYSVYTARKLASKYFRASLTSAASGYNATNFGSIYAILCDCISVSHNTKIMCERNRERETSMHLYGETDMERFNEINGIK